MGSTEVETSARTSGNPEEKIQEFRLEPEQELRFEVEANEKVLVELRSGLAESFGTEMMKGKKYEFKAGAKVAVYTWHGCTLSLKGNTEVAYVAKETPMTFYINIHGCLENMREKSASEDVKGPTVMVCGPCDVGKSSLCRLLLNYGVRRGRNPMFVDLDVGQGSLGVPGTVGINVIERPADLVGTFSQVAPIIFHYGALSPSGNFNLYQLLISTAAKVVNTKAESDQRVKHSGVIINTCGWVSGGGYKSLLHAVECFEVDVVLVLDQERLYNELVRDLPNFTKTIFTPKSGGVVVRPPEFRSEARNMRIREYFYGTFINGSTTTQFYPHSFDVPFSQMKIYKIGAPSVPDSCLPIGMKANDTQTKLVPMSPGHGLLHHMLALSFCSVTDNDKSKAIETNVQGYICVTAVDVDRQMITVLSPQPRPLPTNCIFLFSSVQFMDSH